MPVGPRLGTTCVASPLCSVLGVSAAEGKAVLDPHSTSPKEPQDPGNLTPNTKNRNNSNLFSRGANGIPIILETFEGF